MIELQNVSKSFGELTVLEPMSLTIPQGCTSVLIGPSGCGKSTLLRMMIGLIESDSGTIRIDGEPLDNRSVNRLRHRIGYILQDGGLFPHLTVEKNVCLLARHLKSFASESQLSQRVDDLAELVKLPQSTLTRYPDQISGGQRQRVAMMRALLLDPPILLLDEPMGALDPLVRHDLQQDLHEAFDKLGKTVVLVTHDMGEAAFFGKDMLLMESGKILQRGSVDDFINNPASPFVTKFLSAQRQLESVEN